MNVIEKDQFLTKGINISTRTIDGIAYIYKEDSRELMSLNETGSFVWGEINGISTVRQIIERCIEEYDGDKKEIEKFVFDFLNDLSDENIIEISSNHFEGVMRSV